MTAAGFVLIGTIFDIGTWYYSKHVKIFDSEEENDEIELSNRSTNIGSSKKCIK